MVLDPLYQSLIQIGQAAGIIIAIIVATYKITSVYYKLRERVKVLEKAIDYHKEQLNNQRQEVSDMTKLFRDTGINMITEAYKRSGSNG